MARYIFRQDALTRWESETPGIRRALAPYRWALDKQPWGSPGALEGLWFQPARKSWHITGSYTVYGPYGEQTVDLDFMVERQPGTRRPDEAAVRETLQWELDERIDEYAAVFDNG